MARVEGVEEEEARAGRGSIRDFLGKAFFLAFLSFFLPSFLSSFPASGRTLAHAVSDMANLRGLSRRVESDSHFSRRNCRGQGDPEAWKPTKSLLQTSKQK